MCCTVMTAAAMLLSYASFREKKNKSAIAYGACAVLAAVSLVLSLSRSGLLALVGVVAILTVAIIAGSAKRPGRLLAMLAVFVLIFGVLGAKVTLDKVYAAYEEDYEFALYHYETYGTPINVAKPEER